MVTRAMRTLPPDVAAPLPVIERALDEYTRRAPFPESLREAVRYALLSGGKRLRPLLAWHSAVAAGGSGESSLPSGVAVELIHAFSLAHDDLPAMDNDTLRRGKPTLHVHAGEAMAILAGDAMLNAGFEVLLSLGDDTAGDTRPTRELACDLARELARGTTGMIAGQVYDSLGGFPGELSDPRRLELVHRNKTGALIVAACRMGVRSAGGSAVALDAITAYASAIGLAFQIVDDLLDVEASPEAAGKRTRKDADAGKLTYPGVLGVAASRAEVARQVDLAERALASLTGPTGPLRALAAFVAHRGH